MDTEHARTLLRNVVESEYMYRGRIVNLRVDHVKFPAGCIKPREVVEHRPAVAILAADHDGCIYLVSQYRHAVDEMLYEIPAGLVEEGENPADTAFRELQEEIGFKPGALSEMFTLYTAPGFSDEKVIFFWATDLTPSKLPQDDDEYVFPLKFTPAEIMRMIAEGEIKDSKTVAAVCWCESQGLLSYDGA